MMGLPIPDHIDGDLSKISSDPIFASLLPLACNPVRVWSSWAEGKEGRKVERVCSYVRCVWVSAQWRVKQEEKCCKLLRREMISSWTNLMRIAYQVLVQQEAGHKLTEEIIVRLIDRPEAPEGVVVRVLTEAKWSSCLCVMGSWCVPGRD